MLDIISDFAGLDGLPLFDSVYTSGNAIRDVLDGDTEESSEIDEVDTDRLGAMLIARYGEWKMYTSDNAEFEEALLRYYRRYKHYYNELLTAYNTTINMLDGRKTVIAYDTTNNRQDSGTDKSNGTIQNSVDGTEETNNYDLPRQTSTENRPSSRTIDISKQGSSSETTNSVEYGKATKTTRGGTVTRTGDADVIDLKKRYMALIQNVYYEFAGRFEPLFVGVFG